MLAVIGCRDSGSGSRPVDGGHDTVTQADHVVFDAYCPADAQGGGVCPINFCGVLKSVAALGLTETGQSGADSLCSDGRSCVATMVVSSGDAFQLTCVAPQAGALPFGAACAPGPGSAQPCNDDSLCVEAADFPGAPFCSALCRVDADCPTGAYCLEHKRPLPDQSYALVGMCTPAAKIAQTICKREADCPAGQGCMSYGARTDLQTCTAGGPKSLGAACTDAAQCRSGVCFDRDFHLPVAGNRAFCTGICWKNSDCGPDQLCVREILANNGTPSDPRDDVIVGYCRTLFAPTAAAACASDQDCVARGGGADSCDTTHGLCFNKAAAIGGACTTDEGCGLGAFCATGPTFANGACLLDGCAPGAAAGSGVDACPGTRSVCSQRASDEPLSRCYEGCAQPGDCVRGAESYFCAAPKDGEKASICLSR
jgi:hypothetical protein